MLWAADSPPGGETSALVGLVNYGILGTLVILAAIGIVYFKPSVTDLKNQIVDQRKDFATQIEALRKENTDQITSLRKDYTDQIANLRKDHTEQITLMRQERDKANEQRDAMADTFQKEWIPALVKSLATVEALIPLMQRLAGRSGGDHQ